MAYDRQQLLSVQTQAAAIAELVTNLTGSGFQAYINDWKPGTFQNDFLQLAAYLYVQGQLRTRDMVLAATEPSASGSFLDAISNSYFDNYRGGGQPTVGPFVLQLAPGNGPYTRQPGECQVVANGTYLFQNQQAFTLDGTTPTRSIAFVAVANGSAYNVPNNSTLTPVIALNGVSFTNPALSGSTTWYTQSGQDPQDDGALHAMNQTKWGTLATAEAPADRVAYAVISNSSGAISQVNVDGSNPRGPGTVVVYCANATGPSPSGDIANVSGSIQRLFFNGENLVSLEPATSVEFAGDGTNFPIQVWFNPSYTSGSMLQRCQLAFNEWLVNVPIGGNSFSGGPQMIADVDDLIASLYATQGVEKVRIGNQGDITLLPSQKLTFPPPGALVAPYLQLTASTVTR